MIAPLAHAGATDRREVRETPELLARYLGHIGKGNLLTHEEEMALSRRFKEGGPKAGWPRGSSSSGTSAWS